MSASRLAIMAGLLTLALAPASAPAARKERIIEATTPLQKLSIEQIGAEFFIGAPHAGMPANEIIDLGSTVRIDQRLLSKSAHLRAGDK
ncbi:hypothetical protein SAMN05518849_11246 [Sphingobium sp. AP50]|uniref:hypothetical protein n=1 Tax=Sphingobium sp. AP50 TaxID=1884369 RepID=UPI0008BC8B17|nr:hypothetical protein [Sphingobium sp. AP50]SEJ73070.1 hypothetical protein SAMN05518849_11246 [Sphingobium sp. AP50]